MITHSPFSHLKTLLLLSLGTLIYYVVAQFDMWLFSFTPSNITLLWLPFGIAVIMLDMFGLKALPFIFIGSFFANYHGLADGHDHYLTYLTLTAFADTLAPFMASFFIRRYIDWHFDNAKILLPFTLYGVLIPTFTSGVIIALTLASGGYIAQNAISQFIVWLMFSDGLGLLLLYPLYVSFRQFSKPAIHEWKKGLVFAVGAFLLIWFSFHFSFLIFLLLPLLLLASFQIRIDLILAILFVSIIEIIALSAHYGVIFTTSTQMESTLMLIMYLISLVFVIIGSALNNRELMESISMSMTDHLTNVKNVKAYKEEIEKLLGLYNRYQIPFSIMILDIDNFKMINDVYGHRIGDKVLIELCDLIQNNIRSSDTLFRVGGEEFVILCQNITLTESLEVAHKIRAAVEQTLSTINDKTITISIGVTEVKSNDTEDSIYRRADTLLYDSKNSGKNSVTSDLAV